MYETKRRFQMQRLLSVVRVSEALVVTHLTGPPCLRKRRASVYSVV